MLSKILKVGAVTLLVVDALWFLRLVSCKLATYFKPKLKPLEESRIYSICTTHDIDFNFHMNNARYIRELDFGRFDLWFRNGLHCFVTRGRYVVQHACTIRYRRPIQLLRPYIIKTRLIWWDARSLYFEQQVVTLHDGFVRAVALAKQTIVNGDVEEIMRTLMESDGEEYCKPEIRADLAKWLEYNQMSSDLLMQDIMNGGHSSSTRLVAVPSMASVRSFCTSPLPPDSNVEETENGVQFTATRGQ